jgi:hypothetical protein
MITYPNYKVHAFLESRKSTAWFKKEKKLGDSREHIQNLLMIITFKVPGKSFGEAKKIIPLERPVMVELFFNRD